jgi:N-acetylmuramoyl-L-alanine amidase
VMVREGDDNPTQRERASRVQASGAQVFVSVHANAADTSNGYLRAAGTGIFYKHPHSRDLAATVLRRMLADTALPELGLVGNFNYTPIRLVTWAPAILVEQAYVSHPGEEAMLLDPAFRARIAKAVRVGLEEHLSAANPIANAGTRP